MSSHNTTKPRGRAGWKPIIVAFVCFPTLFAVPLCAAGPNGKGPFDDAIQSATQRVIKLYGLGAGAQAGYGSGILVSEDGQVLTVLSLLIDSRRLKAVTSEGIRYGATVRYRDPQRQLALLQLRPWREVFTAESAEADENRPEDRVGPFPYFTIEDGIPHGGSTSSSAARPASRDALMPGDWVVAAGNAFKVAEGAEPVSIAHGVFSTRTRLDARRRVRDFPYRGEVLVIDAVTSNPGSPGGAVVDIDGRLVGMIGRDVVSNLTHTYFNYAVPRDVLDDFFREALTNPECRVATPEGPSESAGLGGQPTGEVYDPGAGGDRTAPIRVDYGFRLSRAGYQRILPFVDRVRGDSPAAKAGLRKDDLILTIGGKNVADVAEYDERIQDVNPDEPLDLVVRRDRRILSIRIEPK